MKIFCDRLRETRGNASQKAFAEILGLNQQTYQRYASGVREPDIENLHRIGVSCGVSIDWLLGLSETPRKEESAINAPNNSGAIAIGGGNAVTRDCMECPLLKDHLKRFSKAIR